MPFRMRRWKLALLGLTLAGAAVAETPPAGQRITAVAVDPAGRPGASTASLTIHLERWSTDEEVARLAGILREKGPQALSEALVDLEAGWVRLGASVGYPIAVARSLPDDEGGRLVRIVVDRPIGFAEVARSTRSEDYPLSLIEIRFDADGKGEGTLYAAVQAHFEGDKLVVESYGVQPARVFQARFR